MGRKTVKQNFPVLATLLTLCAIVILCALGTWQVQRLQWKEGVLAQIESARAAGPQDIKFQDIEGEGSVPLYARLRGRYGAISFSVGPRTYGGVVGFHSLVPFMLEDGGAVLVNRGWVPQGQEENLKTPQGIVSLSGLLRLPERDNPFVPQNNPEKGAWFRADPVQMAQVAGVTSIAPMVMYVESESPESASLQPVRAAAKWTPPNDHLQYALFWFSMAGILLVIYFLRFWCRRA